MNYDLQTFFIYIIVFFSSIIFLNIAQKYNQKKYLYLVVIILSLLCGLRRNDVGIDTNTYVQIFDDLSKGKVVYGIEFGFKYFSLFLLKISSSPAFLFTIYSLIINSFMFARFWDFKDEFSLPIMFVVYFIFYYFYGFNILRQMLAISIVFYATRYLDKNKYITFLILLLISSAFHKSTLINILLLIISFLVDSFNNKEKRKKLLYFLLLLLFISVPFIRPLLSYIKYLNNFSFNLSLMIILKIIIFFIFYSEYYKRLNLLFDNDAEILRFRKISLYYIFGLFITLIGNFFPFGDRIGISFILFECIFYGILLFKGKNQYILNVLFIFLCIYVSYSILNYVGQGVNIYRFFWQ